MCVSDNLIHGWNWIHTINLLCKNFKYVHNVHFWSKLCFNDSVTNTSTSVEHISGVNYLKFIKVKLV